MIFLLDVGGLTSVEKGRNMKDIREKGKRTGVSAAGWLLVILASVLYVILLAGGNPEAFLIDDNRTQWYPVMERAYEDLWNTGRIYCYDFYQMKGMSVAGQGYYGVMNPFILISYTVTKLLPGGIDAITFYIGLMVVLGNLFFYLTCRRLGCKELLALLMTLTYSTMGCFWAFFYWYYVFNNYFVVPLLVYVFLCCTQKGRLSYCACGIVLAMDLWMGNVQYTFYHYILFGILCLTMMILKNVRYFKILCANGAVGIALSLPMLLLLLQASGGFQKREEFMMFPLTYFSLMIHSAIPQGILQWHGGGFSFLDSFIMGRNDNLVCYMGVVGLLLFAALLCVVGRFLKWSGKLGDLRGLREALRAGYDRATAWPYEKKTIAGCVAALLFFLSLMSGGVAAYFLSVTPVVRNFRYLFKAIFPAMPLAVLTLAYIVSAGICKSGVHSCESGSADHEDGAGRTVWHFRSAAAFLLAAYACVGVVNACDTVKLVRNLFDMRIERDFAGEKTVALSALATAGVDGKNYRTAAFLQFGGLNDECFDMSRNLTRNFATAVGIFSLAGYEIATEESRLQMFDAVYSDTNSLIRYANADTLEDFYLNLQQEPEKVQRQLVDNSVRYLLLDKTTLADNRLAQERESSRFQKDRREEVIAALQTLPAIRVERVCPFNDYYDLVELAGTTSLCRDGESRKIPLTDENMQTLFFDAQAGQDYTLSFAWDPHLEAFLTEADGSLTPLPVEETENGDIRISTAGNTGRVMLTWRDPLCTAGFVWEGATALLFFGMLVTIAFCRQKCYSNNTT